MFKSDILLVPGLGNSDENHWQSYWEKLYHFNRVKQRDWDTPNCKEWVEALNNTIAQYDTKHLILVGHSLACATIAKWSATHNRKIKAALLVAPADTEAPDFPTVASGFAPMSLHVLPFPSIVVASNNDPYVSIKRAEYFASCWGSDYINIGSAGHINSESCLNGWSFGLDLLKRLDQT